MLVKLKAHGRGGGGGGCWTLPAESGLCTSKGTGGRGAGREGETENPSLLEKQPNSCTIRGFHNVFTACSVTRRQSSKAAWQSRSEADFMHHWISPCPGQQMSWVPTMITGFLCVLSVSLFLSVSVSLLK